MKSCLLWCQKSIDKSLDVVDISHCIFLHKRFLLNILNALAIYYLTFTQPPPKPSFYFPTAASLLATIELSVFIAYLACLLRRTLLYSLLAYSLFRNLPRGTEGEGFPPIPFSLKPLKTYWKLKFTTSFQPFQHSNPYPFLFSPCLLAVLSDLRITFAYFL